MRLTIRRGGSRNEIGSCREGRLGQVDLRADTALVLGPGLPIPSGPDLDEPHAGSSHRHAQSFLRATDGLLPTLVDSRKHAIEHPPSPERRTTVRGRETSVSRSPGPRNN